MGLTTWVVIALALVNIALLVRCGMLKPSKPSSDYAGDRERERAILESNMTIARHSHLQYQGNERLTAEMRLMNRNIELLIELEQAKHTAVFTHIDEATKSA